MRKKISLLLIMALSSMAFAGPGNMPKIGWIIFSTLIFVNVVWGTIDLFVFGKSKGFFEYGFAIFLFFILAFIDNPDILKGMLASLFECYI